MHAILNPSSSERWLTCHGSVPAIAAMKIDGVDDSSEYADEGTAAHTLGSSALNDKKLCAEYEGQTIDVKNDGGTVRRQYKVDADMASAVQVYVDSVNDKVHESAILLVESRVSTGIVSMLYGPIDGTADAIVIMPQFKLIDVTDLKFGRGVRVEAPKNSQLRCYGAGALRLVLEMAEVLGLDPKDIRKNWKIRMCIQQPRLDHYSDETLTVKEMEAWLKTVETAVERIDAGDATIMPSDGACRWCPLKKTCQPLAQHALDAVLNEFKDIPDLTDWGIGKALEKIELIETWVAAIRKAAWDALNTGMPIPGWKLVDGRAGNREWDDAEAVEQTFKSTYRLTSEQMYGKPKLISPTTAEKLFKTNPVRWQDLQAHIVRKPGQKTLARDIDTRPVASSILDQFK